MILNRVAKLALIASMAIFSVNSAVAEVLSVEYKSFYSHVKQLDKEELNALQFAFGFLNIHSKSLCKINAARISTDKKQIPLEVSTENRFTVPSEKALRLADALVVIDLDSAANICDMSVQLETKPEYLKSRYTQDELTLLFNQYEAFFDKMGGFMSFMMPHVTGIKLVFPKQVTTHNLQHNLNIQEGALMLNQSQIADLDVLELPTEPLRITAVTSE